MTHWAPRLAATILASFFVVACSGRTPPAEVPDKHRAAPDDAPSPIPVIAEAVGEVSDADLLAMLTEGDDAPRHKMPLLEGPVSMRGSPEAPVELVLYFDYQCPYSLRLNRVLNELLAEYDGRLRVRYRHFPLPMHQRADELARASLAAAQAGAFDGVHDRLFEMARRSDQLAVLTEIALGAGLDAATLTADAQGADLERRLNEHLIAGRRVGVRSTPTWFINGRAGRGAIQHDELASLIDAELVRVDAIIAAGVPPGRVPARIDAVARAEAVPTPTPTPKPSSPAGQRRVVDTTGLPRRGSIGAPIQLLMCGDFDCPYCARAVGILDELERRYPGKLAIFFQHRPLPFHKGAEEAARFAWAAQRQGFFWQAWRALYAGRGARSGGPAAAREQFQSIARREGMRWSAVEADMKSSSAAQAVAAGDAQCEALGAKGTPTFFLNGRKISGAQPAERFAAIIDEELGRP